jgi:hypothetical protein
VPATESTIQVLVDMWRDRKTCMGITNPDGGELIGNVSISDLRQLTPELFQFLAGPIGNFVLAIRGEPVPEVSPVSPVAHPGTIVVFFQC